MGWKFKITFAAFLLLLLCLLPGPDHDRLLEIQGAALLKDDLTRVLALPEMKKKKELRLSLAGLSIICTHPDKVHDQLTGRLRQWLGTESTQQRKLVLTPDRPHLEIKGVLRCGANAFTGEIQVIGAGKRPPGQKEIFFHTWVSLVPPFLAILLAVILGRTIVGLFTGAIVGAWILSCSGFAAQLGAVHTTTSVWEWFTAMGSLLMEMIITLPAGLLYFGRDILIGHCLCDQFRAAILFFVVFLCATVGVMTKMGALQGLAEALRKKATTGRRTQFATALLGLVIFFDDYANTIVVGNTMRLLTDRFRIAREKLAYLVDSTSAPVAGLSLLSTWIAYEVSTFSPQLPEVGINSSQGYAIFLQTLPFRYYCIFTLAFVFVTILSRREFGPMLQACERAARTGQLVRPGGRALTGACPTEGITPAPAVNALVPIGLLLTTTIICLAIFRIDSVYAIFLGSLLAFLCASTLAVTGRHLSLTGVLTAAWEGTRTLAFALVILILAWAIGFVCDHLGTAPFLVASFHQIIQPLLLPVILFLASAMVSFSTGSSWSTMAIMLPNIVILSHTLGEGLPIGSISLMIISIGAVLEGSIFGDHCSPISDTTILSSVASGSDHLDHTRTQIFYALTTMTAALLFGYLPAALLGPQFTWLFIPLGILALYVFLRIFGRRPTEYAPAVMEKNPESHGLLD